MKGFEWKKELSSRVTRGLELGKRSMRVKEYSFVLIFKYYQNTKLHIWYSEVHCTLSKIGEGIQFGRF